MQPIRVEAFKLPMQKAGRSTAEELQFVVLKHHELGYLVEPRLVRLPLKSVLKRARNSSGTVFMAGGKYYLPLEWMRCKQKKKLAGVYIKYMQSLIGKADVLFPHRVVGVMELSRGEW